MNTRQENHGEPEQSEGFGKRVRRFVDSELNRFRDKEDREAREERARHPDDPGSAQPGDVPGSAHDSHRVPEPDPTHESAPTYETGPARHPEPAAADAGDHAGHPAAAVPHDATGGAQRVGLLNDVVGLRDEWQRVQGTFVDDPERAVHEAGVLIDRTLEEIRANVGSAHPREAMSTEDLRVSFQRYREFFQRLLSA